MACVVAVAAVTGAADGGADAHKEFLHLLLLQSTVECFVDVGTAAAAAAVVAVLRNDCLGSCWSGRLAGRKQPVWRQQAQWQTEQIHGRPQTID